MRKAILSSLWARLLLGLLALAVLAAAAWFSVGPRLLSPLVPRGVALYLPGLDSLLSYRDVAIDRFWVVTFTDARLEAQKPLPLRLEAPSLHARLSITALLAGKLHFSALEADSARLVLAQASLPASLSWADTLLDALRAHPDTRVFEGARLQLASLRFFHNDTLLARLKDVRLAYQPEEAGSAWKVSAQGELRRHGDRLLLDSLRTSLRKKKGRPFQIGTTRLARALYEPSPHNQEFYDRDACITWLRRTRDYGFMIHGDSLVLEAGRLQVRQTGVLDFSLDRAELQNLDTAQTWFRPLRLIGYAHGWIRAEVFKADSLMLRFALPQEPGPLRLDLLWADTLMLTLKGKQDLFASREEIGKALASLHDRPPLRLLGEGRLQAKLLHYRKDDQNYFWAREVELTGEDSAGKRLMSLRSDSVSARFHGDGFELSPLETRLRCPLDSGDCQVLRARADTLKLAFDAARLGKGPAALLRETHLWGKERIWKLLAPEAVQIKDLQLRAGPKLYMHWSGPTLVTRSPSADSLRLTLRYKGFALRDSVLLGQWLPEKLHTLSQGTLGAASLQGLLSQQDFGVGQLDMALGARSLQSSWNLGQQAPLGLNLQAQANLDLSPGVEKLSGNINATKVPLTRLYATLFARAKSQGIQLQGTGEGRFSCSIPLASLDRLSGFKGEGSFAIQDAQVSGLYIQKDGFLKARAPLYTAPMRFSSVRGKEVAIDQERIFIKDLSAIGPSLSLQGHASLRYDASFVLEAKATVPAKAAQQLPALTRNGMESLPGGARRTPLSLYGDLYKQEFSDMGALYGQAVVNNFKQWFGVTNPKLKGKQR